VWHTVEDAITYAQQQISKRGIPFMFLSTTRKWQDDTVNETYVVLIFLTLMGILQ
jgi:hypothetical protein